MPCVKRSVYKIVSQAREFQSLHRRVLVGEVSRGLLARATAFSVKRMPGKRRDPGGSDVGRAREAGRKRKVRFQKRDDSEGTWKCLVYTFSGATLVGPLTCTVLHHE